MASQTKSAGVQSVGVKPASVHGHRRKALADAVAPTRRLVTNSRVYQKCLKGRFLNYICGLAGVCFWVAVALNFDEKWTLPGVLMAASALTAIYAYTIVASRHYRLMETVRRHDECMAERDEKMVAFVSEARAGLRAAGIPTGLPEIPDCRETTSGETACDCEPARDCQGSEAWNSNSRSVTPAG